MADDLQRAVWFALQAAAPDRRDAGAAALAMIQAQAIDADPGRLERIGPALLRSLDSLGLTLRSRTTAGGGDDEPEDRPGPFDELRRRRRTRGQIDPADTHAPPA